VLLFLYNFFFVTHFLLLMEKHCIMLDLPQFVFQCFVVVVVVSFHL
jgi:hypothetical protein